MMNYRFAGFYTRSGDMRLKGLPYKPEEELSDAELNFRLKNINDWEDRCGKVENDLNATDEQIKAAFLLRSIEFSYFFRLRWIRQAETNKRKLSSELIGRQTELETIGTGHNNVVGHPTEFADRPMILQEVDRLQKSIDSEISKINGERAYIKEHENEINDWLTAIGLSDDDDLRPAGMIERVSRSEELIADAARDREEPSGACEIKSEKRRNLKKGRKPGDTDPSTCDLVTNPPQYIIVEGEKYHFKSYRYADGIDFTFEQAQAVALRYHYGIEKNSVCGRFLGIAHSTFRDRINGADKKMVADLNTGKRHRRIKDN